MCEREPDNASDRYAVAVIRKSIPDMEIVLLKIQSSISTCVHDWNCHAFCLSLPQISYYKYFILHS